MHFNSKQIIVVYALTILYSWILIIAETQHTL